MGEPVSLGPHWITNVGAMAFALGDGRIFNRDFFYVYKYYTLNPNEEAYLMEQVEPGPDGAALMFVFDPDEEGPENGTSGSWSEWEKEAYEMRVLRLLQEAEELQAKADMLNQHALAMSEITAGLAFCAVILSVTGIGGIIAGTAALATGAAAIALSIVASGYSEMARRKREEAMNLLESHL